MALFVLCAPCHERLSFWRANRRRENEVVSTIRVTPAHHTARQFGSLRKRNESNDLTSTSTHRRPNLQRFTVCAHSARRCRSLQRQRAWLQLLRFQSNQQATMGYESTIVSTQRHYRAPRRPLSTPPLQKLREGRSLKGIMTIDCPPIPKNTGRGVHTSVQIRGGPQW